MFVILIYHDKLSFFVTFINRLYFVFCFVCFYIFYQWFYFVKIKIDKLKNWEKVIKWNSIFMIKFRKIHTNIEILQDCLNKFNFLLVDIRDMISF